jgi:DNA-binding GntR family transcriptional regulator
MPTISSAISSQSASESDVPLAELAYRNLRRAIVRCEFEPGQRMRVDELSRQYQISSSPVREALSRLTEQGLIRTLENRGFRVAPLTVEGIQDLTRVRLLVEGEALKDAMIQGTDRWEAGVVGAAHALSLVEQRLGEGPLVLDEEWSERHRDFHLAIYAGCTSPMLLDLVAGMFDQAERYRRFSALHRRVDRSKNAEHQVFVEAVLARGQETALGLFRKHILGTETNVIEALQRMAAGAIQ